MNKLIADMGIDLTVSTTPVSGGTGKRRRVSENGENGDRDDISQSPETTVGISTDMINKLQNAIANLDREILKLSSAKLTKPDIANLVEASNRIKTSALGLSLENSTLSGRLLERELIRECTRAEVLPTPEVSTGVDIVTPTFAEIVARPAQADPKPAKKRSVPRKRKQPHVIKVVPVNSTDYADCEAVKSRLKQLVNPDEAKITVKRVKNIRNRGVIIEASSKEDIDFFLQNENIKDAGLMVSLPEKRNPRIIIYDVESKLEASEVKELITRQNPELGNEVVKACFKTGPKTGEFCNWVMEVSPSVRAKLIRKRRVYMNWNSCRVSDFVISLRCFKCHVYGHISKHCNVAPICGHCGENGHTRDACKNRNTSAVCSNCIKAGRPHNHSVRERKCPAFKEALQLQLSRAVYE